MDYLHPTPRIVSLLPSATEILAVLGLGAYQVGRSHECDYPPEVVNLPICTAPQFNPEGTSGEIHDRVTDLLTRALGVYRVELEQLAALQPTHILTQAQCDVCAVSLADVEAAVASLTGLQPQIISLQPNCLAELWADLERVSDAIGGSALRSSTAAAIAALQARIKRCQGAIAPAAPRPRVACIEWTDPLMAAGNWIPELVTLAGATACFGQTGVHSPWIQWADLVTADPDLILFMPCGYDLPRTRAAAQPLTQQPQWSALKAVQTGQVYVTDGNQYFNRPGPRLVESLEILVEICHPGAIAPPQNAGTGWQPL
ncbi:MAG: cobalamin-binding protein [Leptolyngbya sp.]|nr:cobalamin-binding protein [Leptolyngbya sp.]